MYTTRTEKREGLYGERAERRKDAPKNAQTRKTKGSRTFVRRSVANKAIRGEKLISVEEVETNIHNIPDMVRDKENVVLGRIEKYFVADAWKKVLNASEKKNKSKWMCPRCSTSIRDRDKSIVCERCLYWYHVSCTSLKGPPKAKNWFCGTCKAKHL